MHESCHWESRWQWDATLLRHKRLNMHVEATYVVEQVWIRYKQCSVGENKPHLRPEKVTSRAKNVYEAWVFQNVWKSGRTTKREKDRERREIRCACGLYREHIRKGGCLVEVVPNSTKTREEGNEWIEIREHTVKSRCGRQGRGRGAYEGRGRGRGRGHPNLKAFAFAPRISIANAIAQPPLGLADNRFPFSPLSFWFNPSTFLLLSHFIMMHTLKLLHLNYCYLVDIFEIPIHILLYVCGRHYFAQTHS